MSAAEFENALQEAIGGKALHKYVAPMNDAEVEKKNSGDYSQTNEYVTFKSDDSSVFSITGGKVKAIAKIDHMKVVIIEKEQIFYTYSNLGSTSLKIGNDVKINQLIGYAAYDLDGFKPTIDLYISNEKENISMTQSKNRNKKMPGINRAIQ
jgi:hypothetical protein